MPAIITHDSFGQDVYRDPHTVIGESRDEYEAFLLGNQGPDPLFFAVLDPRLRAHIRFGSTMHAEKPTELIAALAGALSVLDEDERAVGRAYALGFLGHYLLDSTVHPFVFAQEHAICDAGIDGLSRDDGSEVHGVIEGELDELVLFTKRGETVATYNPATEILKASPAVLATVSKMYGYLALTVYGVFAPVNLFSSSVHCYRFAQQAFYSPTGAKRAIVGHLERLARRHSFFQAMSHRPVALTESAFDNHAREPWQNPFTEEVRTESFWDLYEHARARAKEAIVRFGREGFGPEEAHAVTDDLNFSGEPTCARLISVESAQPRHA